MPAKAAEEICMPINLNSILAEHAPLAGTDGHIKPNYPVTIMLAGFGSAEAEGAAEESMEQLARIVEEFFKARLADQNSLAIIAVPAIGSASAKKPVALHAFTKRSGEATTLPAALAATEEGFLTVRQPFEMPRDRRFHIAIRVGAGFPALMGAILESIEAAYCFEGNPFELKIDLYAFLSEDAANESLSRMNAQSLRLLERLSGECPHIGMVYIASDRNSQVLRSPDPGRACLDICLGILLKDCEMTPGSARFDEKAFIDNARTEGRGAFCSMGSISLESSPALALAAMRELLGEQDDRNFSAASFYSLISPDKDCDDAKKQCAQACRKVAEHVDSVMLDQGGYGQYAQTNGDCLKQFFGETIDYYAEYNLEAALSGSREKLLKSFAARCAERAEALPNAGLDRQPLGFYQARSVIKAYLGGTLKELCGKADGELMDARRRVGGWGGDNYSKPKDAGRIGPNLGQKLPDYPYRLAKEYVSMQSEYRQKELACELLRSAKTIFADILARCDQVAGDLSDSKREVDAALNGILNARPGLMRENFIPYYRDKIQSYIRNHRSEYAQELALFFGCDIGGKNGEERIAALYARLWDYANKIAANVRPAQGIIGEIYARLHGVREIGDISDYINRAIGGGHVYRADISGAEAMLHRATCYVAPNAEGTAQIAHSDGIFIDHAAAGFYVLYYIGAFSMGDMAFGRRYASLLEDMEGRGEIHANEH
jgi:hypothetical protein